ncbi:MAG: GNAT family N-acetyltransferase [Bryobacteraceae bacterium]|nr:GNAT family N-acetyltransferase [Bryobacteraceae bacterium]
MNYRPLTQETWPDFVDLFGAKGACGGCWCMAWRRTRADFENGKGAGNRRAMKNLVDRGREPGILLYRDGVAAGWCSLAPRNEFVFLQNARTLKPVDDQPVWSISCFFLRKQYRRKGLSSELLEAAADFARRRGARILEGYPSVPKSEKMPDVFAWTGLPGAFRKAGFVEVGGTGSSRQIMRRQL